MKKLIKKSLAVIIGTAISLSLFSFPAYAGIMGPFPEPAEPNPEEGVPTPDQDTQNAVDEFFNPYGSDDVACVDEKGADRGYIITILEEAFETQTSNSDPNYQTRICYRNNYQVKNLKTGKINNIPKLLTTCSPTAKRIADTKSQGDIEIRFGCKEVLVILSKGGTTMIYGYIGMIYRWAARLVGLIAVLVIVLSGMQLAAAGGDSEAVNSAKKRIIQSLAGIAILFLSSLILNTVNPTFYIISP